MADDQTIYGDYPGDSDYWVNAHRCVSQCIHPCAVCPPGAHEGSGDGWCTVCPLSAAAHDALQAHRRTHGGE